MIMMPRTNESRPMNSAKTTPRMAMLRIWPMADGLRATPCAAPFAAPLLGQHNEAVLREAGYSTAEIEALAEAGALGTRAAASQAA